MNALRSELIKLRAHRITWWLVPLVVAAMVSVAVLALLASLDAMNRGASRAEQLELVAVAPASGTLVSGLLIGVFAIIMVTSDTSTGVINLSLQVLSRRAVLLAKLSVGAMVTLTVSVAGLVGIALAAVIILPHDLLIDAMASRSVWVNVVGVLTTHVTWMSLGGCPGGYFVGPLLLSDCSWGRCSRRPRSRQGCVGWTGCRSRVRSSCCRQA